MRDSQVTYAGRAHTVDMNVIYSGRGDWTYAPLNFVGYIDAIGFMDPPIDYRGRGAIVTSLHDDVLAYGGRGSGLLHGRRHYRDPNRIV